MSDILKVIKQTLWQAVGKVVTSLSTFLILGIIARNYHEAGVGVFTLGLTYLNIFNLVADFGFNAHELRNNKLIWQKLLGLRIIWSVILSVIALVVLLSFNRELIQATFFGILAILGSAIFITCNLIFQKKHRYDLSVLALSIGTIVGLLAYIWLTTLKLPIAFLLLANSLSWVIIALSSLLLVKKFFTSPLPIFDMQYITKLFKQTWPIAATLALNVVYFRADAFIVSHFRGISQAGVYNTAYAIFQSALVIPTFVMNAYYPLMLKSLANLKWVGLGLLLISTLSTITTFIISPLLVVWLTGGGFAGSVTSLQILSLGFPAFFMSSLLMWLMIKRGQYKKMLAIYTFGLLINLILNFIFIPKYSYFGASWITVISEYLILILLAVSVFVNETDYLH